MSADSLGGGAVNVDNNGNVGIGTTRPNRKLDVAGDIRLSNTDYGTRLVIRRTSPSEPWSPVGINPGAFVIDMQSKGTSQPKADLALQRDGKHRLVLGDEITYLSSQDNGDIRFLHNLHQPGEIETMRITNAGNVGIGTTEPQHKLDVEGYVQAHGYYTGDIVFQKDGSNLWRMFEDEKGLYLESLSTGEVYRFVLEKVEK
jgi:hypothetical protein